MTADLDLDRWEAVARAAKDAIGDDYGNLNEESALNAFQITFLPSTVLALIAALRELEPFWKQAKDGWNRVDTAEAECLRLHACAKRAEADAAKMRAVVDAAKEWRAHTFGCSITQAVFTKPGRDSAWSKPCTCGFDQMAAALAALEPTP